MQAYKTKIQLARFPGNSVVVYDPIWGDYYIGDSVFGTRGNVSEGEFFLLLNWARINGISSILEPLETQDDE